MAKRYIKVIFCIRAEAHQNGVGADGVFEDGQLSATSAEAGNVMGDLQHRKNIGPYGPEGRYYPVSKIDWWGVRTVEI